MGFLLSNVIALAFCMTVPLFLTPVLSEQRMMEFVFIPSPPYGPTRLDSGWVDRTLSTCAATCIARYPQTCQSVMYNTITQLCTPGHWLNQSQPRPDVTEGQLYATHYCEYQNFGLVISGTASACIYYVKTQVNHADARAHCESLDSHLYTIRTMDKFYILQNVVDNPVWIGLDDLEKEAVYRWEDNGQEMDPALMPKIFAPGEPSLPNQDAEDCISMRVFIYNKQLNDDRCGLPFYYVCEKPLIGY